MDNHSYEEVIEIVATLIIALLLVILGISIFKTSKQYDKALVMYNRKHPTITHTYNDGFDESFKYDKATVASDIIQSKGEQAISIQTGEFSFLIIERSMVEDVRKGNADAIKALNGILKDGTYIKKYRYNDDGTVEETVYERQ